MTLIAALILALSASYAAAQEPAAIELSLTDAAAVFGAAERVPGLEAEVGALRAEVAALKDQLARLEKLAVLDAEIIARLERTVALADQETKLTQDQREAERKAARRGSLGLRVQARAGAGGLAGVALVGVFPPAPLLGAAAGALVGLVEHWLTD